jgi:succinoglycan biosynthesis protein ExoL
LNVLYLVHNLADAAVWRRVEMLRRGGAAVEVAGFRRADSFIASGDDGTAIELGQTFDAKFAQRLMAIAAALPAIRRSIRPRAAVDVIIARNLEMLMLANRLAPALPGAPAVVYECLDIHRLLLRQDMVGGAMRQAERMLARRCALLLTSSPAFVREYFGEINPLGVPALLIENKVLDGGGERGANPALAMKDGPIRIGWFGALRCSTSLRRLADFTRAASGRFEVVLRGKPALSEFDDFHGFVAAEPFMRFEGPYRNPEDLAQIYSEVQFAWAIDYFEAGQNSKWLLPNRVYEGCLHGAIPIALKGTETARFLGEHGIGMRLEDTDVTTMMASLGALSEAQIAALARGVAEHDPRSFVLDDTECAALVTRLGGLGRGAELVLEAA